jgi:hypothetical protein
MHIFGRTSQQAEAPRSAHPEAPGSALDFLRAAAGSTALGGYNGDPAMAAVAKAYLGYQDIFRVLDGSQGDGRALESGQRHPGRPEAVEPAAFYQAFEAWVNGLTPQEQQFARETERATPGLTYTLVATPLEISPKQLEEVADYEIDGQGPEIWEAIVQKHTPSELAGANPKGLSVKFGLVPSHPDSRLTGTVKQQRKALTRIRNAAGLPNLRTPSPLELLAARLVNAQFGTPPVGETRHFDLPEHAIHGGRFALSTTVEPRPAFGAIVSPKIAPSQVDHPTTSRLLVG